MAISPFDSVMFRELYGDAEAAALFTEAAQIRAMLLFEGALAEVQGRLGIIPQDSAFFIARSAREVQIDPAALAAGTARDGVVAPALVAAFRREMQAPEHAKWIHWGATSQDVIDTGLVLRLRRLLDILDSRLAALADTLAQQASRHAGTVLAARTRSQMATPTTLGAKIAVWAAPLARHRERLAQMRPRLLTVSLAGASGTNAALAGRGTEVMEGVADALGLAPSPIPWHAARDSIAELAGWLAMVTGSLGKMGGDIILLTQSEIREISAGTGGASSTMPHKSNPVEPETLVTLARRAGGDLSTIQNAMLHAQERDGAAWALEWMALPALCMGCAAALRHAATLAQTLEAAPERMRADIDATRGMMMAEAATFALSAHMPRPEAQTLVKRACAEALAQDSTLGAVLPGLTDVALDWDAVLDPASYTGDAPLYPGRLAPQG
ncbi:3-carboxy-cis,cis-muconate cycloisomerase [Paroceanicella profunda]|uniref:3-carboxy-cis,cis-muconate cycloisomerase n=1 Tax=Paroceanicella profunda TaxID=2579971 RepID=A0A5B8FFW8_9RHOB|nr:3-carboxy-cis,cis-muconate cycloisomerase [Paroceanicella profunda]QDL90481.1 3-carboxy-cis,cis-muconate cycloisomerase [Paroceanicella profunda]